MPRDALGRVIPGSYNPAQAVSRMTAQATRLPTPAVTGIMKTPNATAVAARAPVTPQLAQQRQQLMATANRPTLPAAASDRARQVQEALAAQQRPIAAQRPLPGPATTIQSPEDVERVRQQDAISRAAGLRGFRAPLAR